MKLFFLFCIVFLLLSQFLFAAPKDLNPKTNPELAEILKDLKAKDTSKGEDCNKKWRLAYMTAVNEIEQYVASETLSPQFLDILIDIVLDVQHDQDLGGKFASNIQKPLDCWTFLKKIGTHLDNDAAVKTLLFAHDLIQGFTFKDLAPQLLGWARESLRLLTVANGLEIPESQLRSSLQDFCIQRLRENFAGYPPFVEFLWKNIDADSNVYENYNLVLSNYHGQDGARLATIGLNAKKDAIRGLAIRIILDQKLKAAYPAAVTTLRQMLISKEPPSNMYDNCDPVAQLSQLAENNNDAFNALLQVHVENDNYDAGQSVSQIIEKTPGRFSKANWEELMKLWSRESLTSTDFDLAAKADMKPILKELAQLFVQYDKEDDFRRFGLSSAILQQNDQTLADFLLLIQDSKPISRLAILQGLERRPSAITWQKVLVTWLESSDTNVAQATFRALQSSNDLAIKEHLKIFKVLPDANLLYTTLSTKIVLRSLTILPGYIPLSTSALSHLIIENQGFVPVSFPFDYKMHCGAWYLYDDDKVVGPIVIQWKPSTAEQIKPVESASDSYISHGTGLESNKDDTLQKTKHCKPPISVISPDKMIEVTMDVSDALRSLGEGKHELKFVYISRSYQRHSPKNPDFKLESPAAVVFLKKDPEWTSGQEILAAINSPDVERREWGWKNYQKSSILESNEANQVIKQLSVNENEKNFRFELKCSDQQIRRTTYVFTGKEGIYNLFWEWDEEDIRDNGDILISTEEKRAFFKDLLTGTPFGNTRLQQFGSPYESKADITFSIGKLVSSPLQTSPVSANYSGTKNYKASNFWVYELSHNPDMKKWFDRILNFEIKYRKR